MQSNGPKYSIIMPVFNAATSLRRSVESLLAQGVADWELVAVDDCSNDGSADILREYAGTDQRIRIVKNSRNLGAAGARNAGLDAACGTYICWLDADDAMEPGLLEALEEATAGGPDAVGWDWYLEMSRSSREMKQAAWSTPMEAVKGLMGGVMRWNLWIWSVRREHWGALRFTPGADMGEDMMAMISLLASAGSAVQVRKPLYRYNAVNNSSISKEFSPMRRRQIEDNAGRVWRNLQDLGLGEELSEHMDYLKLYLKLPLLQSQSFDDYRCWYGWFPEANASATRNPAIPVWTKFQQWMASRRLFLGLWLYYTLICKLVYGVIYR